MKVKDGLCFIVSFLGWHFVFNRNSLREVVVQLVMIIFCFVGGCYKLAIFMISYHIYSQIFTGFPLQILQANFVDSTFQRKFRGFFFKGKEGFLLLLPNACYFNTTFLTILTPRHVKEYCPVNVCENENSS